MAQSVPLLFGHNVCRHFLCHYLEDSVLDKTMSDSEFGNMVKSIVEDLAMDATDRADRADDGPRTVKATVKGKARVEPRVVRVAAWFADGGGSLDCRRGDTDRRRGDTTRGSGWASAAGDLAVPDYRSRDVVAEDAAGKAAVSKAKVRTVEEKLGREKGYFSHKSW